MTHCTTLNAGLVGLAVWRFVALMRRKMVELLMPRSSVRSMRTTSPAGRSSEKLVKTQGVPGRNSAICCSVSVASKCRAPLDMRRLPCHGPGLRRYRCPIPINYSTLIQLVYSFDRLYHIMLYCYSSWSL